MGRKKSNGFGGTRNRRGGADEYAFSEASVLYFTSHYRGKYYVVKLDERECLLAKTEFELLIEYGVARRTTTTGYLTHEKCLTVPGRNKGGYIATLADRVRVRLGGKSFLVNGNLCYYLPFRKDNVRFCPGILEMHELNSDVLKKLSAVIGESSSM